MDQYPGAEFINDTAAHDGRYGKIFALQDSVVATLVAKGWTGSAPAAFPMKAGCEIEGVFTGITLTSGTVVAYKI